MDRNIREEISEGQDIVQLGKVAVNSRAYVSRFNFFDADQQKTVPYSASRVQSAQRG